MAIIRYTGIDGLKADEKKILKGIIEGESWKITRVLPDLKEMVVTIKTLKPEDKKTRRHILNIKASSPLHTFMAKVGESEMKRSGSYDLTIGCHKIMKMLEEQVKHKLKRDMVPWKKKAESMRAAKK